MKTIPILRCLALLAAVLMLTLAAGCEQRPAASRTGAPTPTPTPAPSAERLRQETNQALSTAGDYLKEKSGQAKEKLQEMARDFPREREELRQKFEQKQRELQPRIDELKRRLNEAGEEAKPEIRRQLDNLEPERQRAAEKLKELGNATADAWESFKARMRQEESAAKPTPTPR